jgi:photosystem II stability/assembly factor-like uncharacterized protein
MYCNFSIVIIGYFHTVRRILLLIFIAGSLCGCEKDNAKLADWTKIYEGPYSFSSVSFPTEDTGYVAGGYTSNDPLPAYVIIKTADGGKTWTELSLPDTTIGARFSVYFTDALTGYLAGSKGETNYTPLILKTIDGGTNWTVLALPEQAKSNKISSVYFTDANNGFVLCTYNGVILRTEDGGNTWTALDLKNGRLNVGYSSIYFTDSMTGYMVGSHEKPFTAWHYYMIVLKTIDGGNTWSTLMENWYLGRLNSVYFKDVNTGYVAGYQGYLDSHHGIIYKTTNGGQTWSPVWQHDLVGVSKTTLSSVYFVDSNTGFASGSSYLKTIDGGTTWTTLNVPDGQTGPIFFTSATTGYIAGYNGIILKTNTGGK